MQVRVLYFAVFRERLGRESDLLELAPGATVADVLTALNEPVIAQLAGRFRIAVNQDFVGNDHVLADRDELALIPPVAGGAGRHVVLSDQPLSLDRCIAAVRGPEIGGIVTFIGMVRRHNHGATIVRLDYEAYAEMAIREMTKLCVEVEAHVPGSVLAVEHRVGRLEIGDLAVAIAAAAPHRAEAFDACRALIDRLKQSVPIWKKEFGDQGEQWVGLGP